MPIPKNKPIKNSIFSPADEKFDELDNLNLDDLDLEGLDLDDIDGDVDDNTTVMRDASNFEHESEPGPDPEPKSKSKPVTQVPSEPQDTGFMEYSFRAYKDGYTFKHLPLDEQRMTKYLYVSEDGLSSFYLALQTASIINSTEERPYFKYGVGMPNDGWYLAYVYGCSRSRSKPGAHVIKLLVSDCDMRCFTFTPGLFDPISVAISRDIKVKNNVFRSAQSYSDLEGCFALFRVENVETQYGRTYSDIKDFKFLSGKELDVVEKMIDIMFEQASK